MKKLICAAVLGFCLFWILGSAGMLECDKISIAEFVARGVPALILLYGSFWIGGFNK
jgi:hypothetical protein